MTARVTTARPERPLGELFSELASETGSLVRQEVHLAKNEMADKAKAAAKEVAVVGVGGAFLIVALLTLVVSAVAGIGAFIPIWLSALIVGVITLTTGLLLVRKGLLGLKHINPAPVETLQTMQENQLWAKRELSR